MANDTSEVIVGTDGIIASGPTTTPAPVDAVALIGALTGFVELGFVSEDGVGEENTQSIEKIKAWQKSAVVRSTVTEGEMKVDFVLIQTNANTLAEYYGADVAADGSIIVDPTRERPHRSYIIDVLDGDEVIRTYIPDGQVTEVAKLEFKAGQAVGYGITITAYDSASIGGAAKKWYASLVTTP